MQARPRSTTSARRSEAGTASVRIVGARAVLGGDVVDTTVRVDGDRIASVGGASAGPADVELDARGLLLAPAMVDVHGDAFERQLMPRPSVDFPLDAALLEVDCQLAGNGIGTAYHALTLSWEPGLRSVARGAAVVDGLERLRARFGVEQRVQLRWETFAFEALGLIERAFADPLTPSLAFNDHTSMVMRPVGMPVQERGFEHGADYALADVDEPGFLDRLAGPARRSGLAARDYAERMADVWTRRPDVPASIERLGAAARKLGVPMLSHDDTRVRTRDWYRERGATIAEFPMHESVARAAREAGDGVVFGAPNAARGGSHLGGSPSAADMVEAGLCDALASDYHYPAMLAAVARLVDERRASLPRAWSLVSAGPARLMGLDDRGTIEPGRRADLVLVDWPDGGTPAIAATMVEGRFAYRGPGCS